MFTVEFGEIFQIFRISSVSELVGNSVRTKFFRVGTAFSGLLQSLTAVDGSRYYMIHFEVFSIQLNVL